MRALIVGGGIAGPVAAMALHRAGVESAVLEAYDGPADHAGWFLNLASNGLDALRAIGLDLTERVDGHPIPGLVFWSGRGRRLGRVRNGVRLDDGTVSECVRRSDLQRVLREEALARGVTIRYGKRLERLEHGVGSVTARFADGTQEAGDILIGADGIHSRTRQLIQPDAPPPVYTGQISVGGYSRLPELEPTRGSQQFIFGRRAFFGYLVRDGGEVWWFANAAHPVSSTAELSAVPPERWRQRMLDLFSDDLPVIRRIVAASSDRIGAHPVFDIPTSRRWSRGPVVLVGDAVHATSPSAGQGASLAIEDAVVLAKCLRDIPEPARAFARYEQLRRERVEKVVAYARKRGSNKTAGPVARVLRDAMMPMVLKLSASDSAHAWMYRYHIDWDAPVVTRDPAR